MKLSINSNELLKALQLVVAVVNHNHTIPACQCFLLDVNENLKVTATDLDMTMYTDVKATGEGKAMISAKLLIDALKNLPNQPIEMISEQGTIKIAASTGEYKLPLENADDFPSIPDVECLSESITVPTFAIAEGIAYTAYCTSADELRPSLSSLMLKFGHDMKIAATDSHRLAEFKRTDISTEYNKDLLLPKKAVNVLKNLLQISENENIELRFNDVNLCVDLCKAVFIFRLVDAKMLNYEAVIPEDMPLNLTVERDTILSSLKRVSVFANNHSKQVILLAEDNSIKITALDVDMSTGANETIPCDYTGKRFEIGFNYKFLMDAISTLNCDKLYFEMKGPKMGVIITPLDGIEEKESVRMLVMPLPISA